MYVIIAPIQIKDGVKEQFLEAMLPNAQGSANTEPGCLRFDVIQDAGDPNRIWLYEVYTDEAAFQAHQQSPHYLNAIGTVRQSSRSVRSRRACRAQPGAAPTSGPRTASGSKVASPGVVDVTIETCTWR